MHDRVRFIERELAARSDPERASAMARYMKTTMPFRGVASPVLDSVLRTALRQWPIESPADYRETVTDLWSLPHREEKYAAIRIARRETRFVAPEHLDLYRSMILEGAWWDLVDDFPHVLCQLLLAEPSAMWPVLDEWIESDDLWLRRVAILAQLDAKEKTDEGRLFSYCTRSMSEREFFIRKAVGWALRQYARTDPDAVRDFCLTHREGLSGLSFREAMKHLDVVGTATERDEKPQKP